MVEEKYGYPFIPNVPVARLGVDKSAQLFWDIHMRESSECLTLSSRTVLAYVDLDGNPRVYTGLQLLNRSDEVDVLFPDFEGGTIMILTRAWAASLDPDRRDCDLVSLAVRSVLLSIASASALNGVDNAQKIVALATLRNKDDIVLQYEADVLLYEDLVGFFEKGYLTCEETRALIKLPADSRLAAVACAMRANQARSDGDQASFTAELERIKTLLRVNEI